MRLTPVHAGSRIWTDVCKEEVAGLVWLGKSGRERRWTGPIVREESKVLNDANLGSSVKTDEKERNRKSGIHMGRGQQLVNFCLPDSVRLLMRWVQRGYNGVGRALRPETPVRDVNGR